MTFKEKLEQEHPDNLNEHGGGGVEGCPHHYGYQEKYDCRDTDCETCWNREMPNTEPKKNLRDKCLEEMWYDKGFEDGMSEGLTQGQNDAWEFIDRLEHAITNSIRLEVFGYSHLDDILDHYTPQEAFAKLKAYEDSKIEVGDVVVHVVGNHPVLVTKVLDNNYFEGINEFGSVYSYRAGDEWKKTGKHIDITSILEQIGE